MRSFLIAFACALLAAAEGQPDRARALYARFMAPCCWQESLAAHRSPGADGLRREIDVLIAAGRSDSEIVEQFVAQHGARILITPRGPEAAWLTILPFAVLATGLWFVLRYLKRHRAPAAALAALAVLSSCTSAPKVPPGPVKEYELRGEVVRLTPKTRVAVIKHEDIPGWMKAMTMEFPVKTYEDFNKLSVGMRIKARVFHRPSDFEYWITDPEPLPPAKP